MSGDRNGRIPLPGRDGLPPEGQAVWDKIVSSPRGAVVGPLRAVLRAPELADLWQEFGAYCRYRTSLPEKLNELAIVVVGRRWQADVEWVVHTRVGIAAGLDPDHIDAIRDSVPPAFEDPAEAEVYDFAVALLQEGDVSDAVYAPVRARWGDQGIVELTAVIGYYSMVAMMLNAHRVPVPDGEAPVFGDDAGLCDLPARKGAA